MPQNADTPADRLREWRRRRGFTQEQLAEQAGLSLAVVKKLERGGAGRLETYHALARALRVRTSQLFDAQPPHTTRHDDSGNLALMGFRRALVPPVTAGGRRLDTVEPDLDLAQMARTATSLREAYQADGYATVAELLPHLVTGAQLAVDHYSGRPEHTEALRLRSDVLQQAAGYLTQIRVYDLAHLALRDARRDALAAGDTLRAGSAVSLQAWTLIREGRLDEAERLSVASAEEIEPRISSATKDALGVWGKLWLKASAAASRNNRPGEAREMLRLARTAGAAVGPAGGAKRYRCGAFSSSSVLIQTAENYAVTDQPRRVLGMSERMRQAQAPTSNTGHRHMLDVAWAHLQLRNPGEAENVLAGLHSGARDWLRHQRMARDTFHGILRGSRQRVSKRQRELAKFFDV
ncbi:MULTISPECIES: helix-turn-helix domain-containing protein [Streptomyces]|uniref:helix-turn-helix domain-containing protein n=1 Tax=Streptomyces TaxID=1883 RepID=UPI00159225E7|nr:MULTISPECIES: helix-turn-helix transcriptional regulator [Streptomyces]QKV69389.1 helix-turn-helix transcriptional regulator [Streptomyces harbinensis]